MKGSRHNGRRVIIFDWDDTLFPSSFIHQLNVKATDNLTPYYKSIFHELGKRAEECINSARYWGEVIVVTNADEGWVQHCVKYFVPNLRQCLETIRVISARTNYEKFFPEQPLCWKAACFAHESTEIYQSTKCHFRSAKEIISFGDSMDEYRATRIVAKQLSAVPKSVMFIQSPNPVQLIGELAVLTKFMRSVCAYHDKKDFKISPNLALEAARHYLTPEIINHKTKFVPRTSRRTHLIKSTD